MSTKSFEATPTPSEPISLETISKENVQEAWKEYEAKPEYKEFNKHDLIESMQPKSDADAHSKL
ncbi:NF038105 family protein [Acinetobacter sp. A47]|uniref:NF038105 family protein n=1 Tax=Acinetobacter sp. A47 TaxID=1561217 RepID=UPI000570D15D|nr:NF038105 family protein [Acinetobacter sp. A47]